MMKIALVVSMVLMGLLVVNPSGANEKMDAGEHMMHENTEGTESSEHTESVETFDEGMMRIMSSYLEIQAALVSDETEGIESAAVSINNIAKTLSMEGISKDREERYQNIPNHLILASFKMMEAKDIDEARAAFEKLSKPISVWVGTEKPESLSVMYCPMRKAGWVQEGGEVANPYLGTEMPRCGQQVVAGKDSSQGDHSPGMRKGGHSHGS